MVHYCWLSFDDCRLKSVNAILIYTYKFFSEDKQYMFYADFESNDTSVTIPGYLFGTLIWDYSQSKIEKTTFCVWLLENLLWI